MALVMPTVFSEDETEWVRLIDEDGLHSIDADHGVSYSKRTSLSADILRTRPPSPPLGKDTSSSQVNVEDHFSMSWEEVSLFTDVRTGIIPAPVHHNAHADHAKTRIKTVWNMTWFQPHLRTLLGARATSTSDPVVLLDVNGDGVMHEWWSDHTARTGVSIAPYGPGDVLGYEELCSGYEKDIFRDR